MTAAPPSRSPLLRALQEFPNGGTTNGAAWYPIYGSMQDWNYVAGDCFELTLELSPGKWPAEGGLAQLWEDNRDALLHFPIVAALGGWVPGWGGGPGSGWLRLWHFVLPAS